MHRSALIPVITLLTMLAPRAVGVQVAATQGVATRSSPDAQRAAAKGTIVYRLSFPEPEHRWMQVEVTFADVPAGPLTFAADFFRRYIEGREVIDWAPLFAPAGIVYKPAAPDRAWLGDVALRYDNGGSMSAPAPMGSPIHAAGIEQDDVLVSLDGEALTSASVLDQVLKRHKPGDAIPVVFQRRGKETKATITLAADPRFEAVPIENAGGTHGEAEKAFREAWLGPRVQRR